MLKRLTVVIPTYNRKRQLLRGMRYWSGKGLSVIYLDGSDCPLEETEVAALSSNISYKYAPIGLMERLAIAPELVSTPYVILLPDDEFLLPSALENIISILDKNSELVACAGAALGFDVRASKPFVRGVSVYKDLIGYQATHDRAHDRLMHAANNFRPGLIYSITRRDVWNDCIKLVVTRDFHALSMMEMQWNMLLHFAGKVYVSNELVWLRSFEGHYVRNTNPNLDEGNDLVKWWRSDRWQQEVVEFLFLMDKAMRRYECDVDGSASAKQFFDVFITKKNESRSLQYKLFCSVFHPRYLRITYPFRKMLLLVVSFRWYELAGIPLIRKAEELERHGVTINKADLNEIAVYLESFGSLRNPALAKMLTLRVPGQCDGK